MDILNKKFKKMVFLNKSEDFLFLLLYCLWYDIIIVWYMYRIKEVYVSIRIVFNEGFKICYLREVWVWMKRNMKLRKCKKIYRIICI